MATTVETLTPRVREALGVSNSYDAEIIPAGIRRAVKKLLRDYNFPKSIRHTLYALDISGFPPDYPAVAMQPGQSLFPIPPAMKRELMLSWVTLDSNLVPDSWSDPLKKLEGFRAPNRECERGEFYWHDGANIRVDRPFGDSEGQNGGLSLTYQSWDVLDNEKWMLEDYDDIIFTLSVYRMSSEMRKAEVKAAYQDLWAEDVTALAVYVNELEYDGLYMMQREPRYNTAERYPV